MLLVPITPYGDIQWDKIFEVESLESWSEGLNERIGKNGGHNRYWIVSPKRVEYSERNGKLIMKYIACERNLDNNAFRLLEFPN
jgi:hypothetical protein